MMRMAPAILTLVLVMVGCAKAPQPAAPQPAIQKENKMEFKLTSTSFKEGQPIPRQHTCDGVNISPALEWMGAPPTAKTFAIICDDPDAPSGTWVHWVLYNLPAMACKARTTFRRLVTADRAHRQELIITSSNSTRLTANFH